MLKHRKQKRKYPSLQSDVGPTSVNGRLWRWFDVECQRWPVVILLIGSTLARLIGSTLDRRYNVLFPTLVQRRLKVVPDVGLTSNANVGPSSFCSSGRRWPDVTMSYFQWFPDQYPTFKYSALVGKTSTPMVCLTDRWADVKSV